MASVLQEGNSETEIQTLIAESRISLRQISVILICFLVNVADGYDVIAIAMAAPSIAEQWQLSPELLGYVLSAELVGIAVGAVLLAALSDRYGRRTILVPSIGLVTLSTFLTVFTSGATELILARLATGLGVGGVLAAGAALAAEFSPRRYKSAVVTIVVMGFSVGSLIAGSIAAYCLAHYDWQSIFLIGAGLGAAVFFLALFFLPESAEFLANQKNQPDGRLMRINRTLKQMRLQPLSALPSAAPGEEAPRVRPSVLLSAQYRGPTLLLWGLFFALFWANYSMGKWLPKLLVNDGFTTTSAVYALTVWVIGSILGSLSISVLSTRFKIQTVLVALLGVCALTIIAFSLIRPSETGALYPLVFLLGLGAGGSLTAIYSVPVSIYPTELRALGLGGCISIGRLGAIFSPILTGYLVGAGWDTSGSMLMIMLPSIIVAMGMLFFWGAIAQHNSAQSAESRRPIQEAK